MKKASMILGIIGGILAIIVALFLVGGGIFFSQMPELIENSSHMEVDRDMYRMEIGNKLAGSMLYIVGGIICIAGIVGIVGGAIVGKNNIAGGIMMIVASFITLCTLWAILSFVLFLIGGIFAFIKDDRYTRKHPPEGAQA